MAAELHPHVKIQLFRDEKCFGPGIAELLQNVEQLSSLRAAAQAMDMAYSKAWTTVRRCEAELGFPLLALSVGGKNGGGARLTPEGKQFLEQYNAYCAALRAESQRLFLQYFGS